MKHAKFIPVILTFLVCSCSQIKQYGKDEICQQIFDQIESAWKFDHETGLYEATNPEFYYTALKNPNCIRGLKHSSIRNLFGEPSLETKNEYRYFTNSGCSSTAGTADKQGCEYLSFSFDHDTKRVTDFSMKTVTQSH